MGRIPDSLREAIGRNIRDCRVKKFPGRGGAKKCAEAFGVSPQQWSPWEKGTRMPDELRLQKLAEFFGVTVEDLRRDNCSETPGDQLEKQKPLIDPAASMPGLIPTHAAGIPFNCPPCCPLLSQWSNVDMRRMMWLLEKFMATQISN